MAANDIKTHDTLRRVGGLLSESERQRPQSAVVRQFGRAAFVTSSKTPSIMQLALLIDLQMSNLVRQRVHHSHVSAFAHRTAPFSAAHSGQPRQTCIIKFMIQLELQRALCSRRHLHYHTSYRPRLPETRRQLFYF